MGLCRRLQTGKMVPYAIPPNLLDPRQEKTLGILLQRISPDHREDVPQTVLLRLCEAALRFDPARQVTWKTFAERHMRGAIRDYFRQQDPLTRGQRLRVKRGIDEPVYAVSESGAKQQSIKAVPIEQAVLAVQLQALVTGLPTACQLVLRALYWDEFTWGETAKRLGIAIETVAWRRHRALALLRQRMRIVRVVKL